MANVLKRLSIGDYTTGDIWNSFGPELVAYGALMILGGVVMWRIVDILDWSLESRVERDIARRVFNKLLNHSANFHANHFGGSLVSQTSKLLGAYIRVADTTVFQVIPLLAAIVFSAIILGPRAPQFTIILVSFSVFFIVTAVLVARTVRGLSAKHATAESKQTGYLADAVTNVMTIKSFAGGHFEQQEFETATTATRKHLLALMWGSQKQQSYFGTITNVISALSLTMAVVGIMVLKADLSTVFLILNYTAYVTNMLWMFGTSTLKTFNRAMGDAQDMIEILNTDAGVKDPQSPESVRINKGAIEFKNMSFSHPDSRDEDVLFKKLSLYIKPGEKIGLVGHSGSGKTTLTKLLLRFNDIDGGEILIDGQNIAHITQDDLRRHIAYVAQEPLLFHRSIRENIAYGKSGATDDEIIKAAHKAYADEFIKTLPQGYDTLVGERGVKLSGGQRQRIAIARAILKDAPILVLDEATSALDSESEVLIQKALWKLMEGRTAIVIAHRLSTIQKMDRILVLTHGEIIEEGSHQSLIKKKGTYAKLWAHQSGGFIEE
jgi:ATP-binding cassette subfamily B protein